MSIRSRILLLLAVVTALAGLTTWAVQVLVVQPGFVDVEREEAERGLTRCTEAIRADTERVSGISETSTRRPLGRVTRS